MFPVGILDPGGRWRWLWRWGGIGVAVAVEGRRFDPAVEGEMADKAKEEFYTRPAKVGNWAAFTTFLWNSETGQFLGRTFSSWGELSLYTFIQSLPSSQHLFLSSYSPSSEEFKFQL